MYRWRLDGRRPPDLVSSNTGSLFFLCKNRRRDQHLGARRLHCSVRPWLVQPSPPNPLTRQRVSQAMQTGGDMAGDAAIGIWGLGVMGRSLAQNFTARGVKVGLYDDWPEARAKAPAAADSLAGFLAALAKPRRILLMIKAGEPVDAAVAALRPLLQPGDLVMDGGNSHWRDSERRAGALAEQEIAFLGLGISGGEVGARLGPSIMAGGDPAAYDRVAPLLSAIAASAEGSPCC